MAVFTTFSPAALELYLVMFDRGKLHSFEPIVGGIENSNYSLTTVSEAGQHSFVLTITENLCFEDIPFFNALLAALDKQGLPVPAPITTLDGMHSTIFCGKPTWLFPHLPGNHLEAIGIAHCRTIGLALAQLHNGAVAVKATRPNPYGPDWVDKTLSQIQHRLDLTTLVSQVAQQYRLAMGQADLPRGIIHGDLFRDNALFVGDDLTGIIDFYHACEDMLLIDIAITMNDWCIDSTGGLDTAKEAALLSGYQQERALTSRELGELPQFRRFAALRFALTRFVSGGEDKPLKDPQVFLDLLQRLG